MRPVKRSQTLPHGPKTLYRLGSFGLEAMNKLTTKSAGLSSPRLLSLLSLVAWLVLLGCLPSQFKEGCCSSSHATWMAAVSFFMNSE